MLEFLGLSIDLHLGLLDFTLKTAQLELQPRQGLVLTAQLHTLALIHFLEPRDLPEHVSPLTLHVLNVQLRLRHLFA